MLGDQGESLSPSQLNRAVRELLDSSYSLLWVSGEVSNFSCPGSGHWYFTLKDDSAQVRCALFRNRNQRLRFRPQNGDAVRLRGRVSLYEARGDFQLIGEFMEPAGAGALMARFAALRDRLRDEGLFDSDRKRALPHAVRHIAVVTSPSGAALQDILTVLSRRDPLLRISVLPVAVQGADAAPQICAALTRANTLRISGAPFDAVLLARGGGSLEDLWAFNEESVARAIAASALPVVSGIGHETDVTIADFAADLRAATPSAAAELLSRDAAALLDQLRGRQQLLLQRVRWRLAQTARELAHRRQRLRHPGARLREQAQRLDEREVRLRGAVERQLASRRHRLAAALLRLQGRTPQNLLTSTGHRLRAQRQALGDIARRRVERQRQALAEREAALRALDPTAILERGYAVISDSNGAVVRDAAAVGAGAQLRARLARGELAVEVVKN